MEERGQESVGGSSGQPLALLVAEPKFVGRGKPVDLGFQAGEEVVLDDVGAVGGVGELQPENLGVILGLLKSVPGWTLVGLRLDDAQGDVPSVAKEEVRILLLQTARLAARDDDPAVGERGLFAVEVLAAVPARGFQLGPNERSAGVGFVHEPWLPVAVLTARDHVFPLFIPTRLPWAVV